MREIAPHFTIKHEAARRCCSNNCCMPHHSSPTALIPPPAPHTPLSPSAILFTFALFWKALFLLQPGAWYMASAWPPYQWHIPGTSAPAWSCGSMPLLLWPRLEQQCLLCATATGLGWADSMLHAPGCVRDRASGTEQR